VLNKKLTAVTKKGILLSRMPTTSAKISDMLRLLRHGGPALCNIAVTNSCNATCDFCNFANGKIPHENLRCIDAARLGEALQILHEESGTSAFLAASPFFIPVSRK